MRRARTLVFGDLHGADRALGQVLDRARFDPAADRLISLGDICDGWPEVDRALDRLLDVPDLTVVLGNHDEWTLGWIAGDESLTGWCDGQGRGTVASYARRAGADPPTTEAESDAVARTVPAGHRRLLESAKPWHIETRPDGRRVLFTHAGWTRKRAPEDQDPYDLRWGRDLWTLARMLEMVADPEPALPDFAEVFLGHTPTEWLEPRPVAGIWNLDQGAGWSGVLTLMDVDTKEWWQSDPVPELYPGEEGRGG